MAGRGPAPKPAHRRARGNSGLTPSVVLEFRPAAQPPLPGKAPGGLGWPARTRVWWAMWGRAAIAETFTESDWSELMDTAVLHAKYWRGDARVAAELRLRVAKFGATPEDRARLRIVWAEADSADARRPAGTAEERYGHLRLMEKPG